jgi:actin-related protein 6
LASQRVNETNAIIIQTRSRHWTRTTTMTTEEAEQATVPAAPPTQTEPSNGTKPKKRRRTKASVSEEGAVKKNCARKKDVVATPPPSKVLLIDNGGDALKFGIVGENSSPGSIPNLTAQLKHQFTTLVGDETLSVQPNQLLTITRPMERGCITNLGCQVQVWKRVLEKLRVQVPLTTEAAEAFGWKVSRGTVKQTPIHFPQNMAVVIMLSPLCPRSIMEQIFHVWFHDFGFSHVGLLTTPAFGAVPTPTKCCCVVDLGWSACQVVPMYKDKILAQNIRRLPIGGRHMIGLWKYYCSYRQWNLMDADFLLQDAHHQLAYVSLDIASELKMAQRTFLGRRPFDREFVLPDYQTTHKGFARLTPQLRRIQDEKIGGSLDVDEEENVKDNQDDSQNGQEQQEEDGDGIEDEKKSSDDEDEDDKEDLDSDEETDEQRRQRLLKQKEEEERRQREIEAQHQTLLVSVERFTIPEVLFRPSDAGFAPDIAGLPQVIVAAIEACPRIYQSALYESIRLVGGGCKLENLEERLQRELRALAPTQYKVKMEVPSDPIKECWINASMWIKEIPYGVWSINKDEYESGGRSKDPLKEKVWHRLLGEEGSARLS